MSKKALTDAGVGRAMFITRLRLSLQAAHTCLTMAAIAFVATWLLWFWFATPTDVDIVATNYVSRLLDPSAGKTWRIRDEAGEVYILTAELDDGSTSQRLTPTAARMLLAPTSSLRVLHLYFVGSIVAAALAYIAAYGWFRWYGCGAQDNKRMRGAKDLVPSAELGRLVRKTGGGQYSFADVALPAQAPMTGILALGAPGSGKSLAIHDLMQQVFARKRKCVIYDQSGEFFRAYFRPGIDVFFNPALEGSVPWSIFSELTYSYNADAMAQAFLPPRSDAGGGKGAFFEDAARALFSVILLRLAELGAQNTADIAKAILEMPADEMSHLIANSVASSAIGGDSKEQRQGVISSIAIYLNGIAAVQPGTWSIRDFFAGPEDRRFFIVNTQDTKAMFAPLFRLLLTAAFNTVETRAEIVHEDRYWFFTDEVVTLGDIRLDAHITTLRKYGVCIVSGIQAETQLVSAMSKERAQTVMNSFSNVLMLSAKDEELARKISRRIGQQEVNTVNRNQALAVVEARDGAGLNNLEATKDLVMTSEITARDKCTGTIVVEGNFPPASVNYQHWLPRPGWWRAKARVETFAAVRDLPPRNPQFLIQVRAGGANALAAVRQSYQQSKDVATGNGVPAASDGVVASQASAPSATAARAASATRGESADRGASEASTSSETTAAAVAATPNVTAGTPFSTIPGASRNTGTTPWLFE